MADTVINGTSLLLYKRTKNTLATSTVNAGGTGYLVNDTFYINNGASKAVGKVTTAAGGIVSAYTITYAGNDLEVLTANTTTNIIGAGIGLRINIATLANTTATYQATGHATSHSLSISMSARDTSSKASGAYTSRETGRLDVSGSAEGLAVYADGVGLIELSRVVSAKDTVFMAFAESTAGSETTPDMAKFYATGFFLLTSVEVSAPDQDNTTYSISFELANSFNLYNIL